MLGNNGLYYIVDSTLINKQDLSINQKKQFLLCLEKIGIEYVEITMSQKLLDELECLVNFKTQNGLRIKLIINTCNQRDHLDKILQLHYPIDCINIEIDVSETELDKIIQQSISNLTYIKSISRNVETILTIKNSFITDKNYLAKIFLSIEDYVDRVCLVDSTGIATHTDVEDLLILLKNTTTTQLHIGCQFYNYSSSAVYNSFIALQNGCTYITTILTSPYTMTDFNGLVSRIQTIYPESTSKYSLKTFNEFSLFNPIFTPDMDSKRLYEFMINYLPNVIEKLQEDYILKLNNVLRNDMSQDNDLCNKLNDDIDFSISYILKYIN